MFEVPRWPASNPNIFGKRAGKRIVLVDDHLGRTQSLNRDAEYATGGKHSRNYIIAIGGEQCLVGQGAWCDDACDLAIDRALARRRVTDLFTDGD
jgi:hypothetical protein